MAPERTPIDFAKAMLNPAAVFDGPESVLEHAALSRDQKVELLRRWEFDALELQVAEEENMAPREPSDLLDRILAALHRLDAGPDLAHRAPTKHGAV